MFTLLPMVVDRPTSPNMNSPDNYLTTYDSKTKIVVFYSLNEFYFRKKTKTIWKQSNSLLQRHQLYTMTSMHDFFFSVVVAPFLLYTIYQKWAFGSAMCALEECVKGNVSVKRYQLTRREHNKDIKHSTEYYVLHIGCISLVYR